MSTSHKIFILSPALFFVFTFYATSMALASSCVPMPTSITNIDMNGWASDVIFDQSAPRAYVAVDTGSGGVIKVIDTTTNTIINTIALTGTTSGSVPIHYGMVMDSSKNLIYIVDQGDARYKKLRIVSTITNTMIDSISIPWSPPSGHTLWSIDLNPEGTFAYIVDIGLEDMYDYNSIDIVNLSTKQVTIVPTNGFIDMLAMEWGHPKIRVNPLSNDVYFTAFDGFYIMDTNKTFSGPYSRGSEDIAFNVLGTQAYVPAGDLSIIDTTTNTATKTITMSPQSGVTNIAISCGDEYAFLSNNKISSNYPWPPASPGVINVVDLSTETLVNSFPVSTVNSYIGRLAVNPSGDLIYATTAFDSFFGPAKKYIYAIKLNSCSKCLSAICAVSTTSTTTTQSVTWLANNVQGGSGSYRYTWSSNYITPSPWPSSTTYTTNTNYTSNYINYPTPNTYTTTLTVSDDASNSVVLPVCATPGQTDPPCCPAVTVTYPPPTASCSAQPSSTTTGQTVTWTVTPGGGNKTYTYNWSGTAFESASGSSMTSCANISCAPKYSTDGTKTATVAVTSNGQTVQANCIVEIDYLPVQAFCTVKPVQALVNQPVAFTAHVTGGSANGDPTGYTYQWSTYCECTPSPCTCTPSPWAGVNPSSADAQTVSAWFNPAGPYTVQVVVSDKNNPSNQTEPVKCMVLAVNSGGVCYFE